MPTTRGDGAHSAVRDGVRGTRFAVWAPNARRVSVVGDFNYWDGRSHVMQRRGGSGVWEAFVPDIGPGALYKFEMDNAHGHVQLKSDPYAFQMQLRPDNASIVALRNQFLDVDSAVQAGDAEILSYEMLEPDGGFHGFHLVVDIAVDGGRTITFDQTSLLDQSASKVYNLIVTCGARCYADNADQIDRVVGSWTVEA